MPDNQTTHTTRIEIGGDVQASLAAAIQQAAAGLKKIEASAVKVGHASKEHFGALTKQLEIMKLGAEKAKMAFTEMLLPLLGISLAFKGFESISGQIETLASNAEKAEMRTADLAATIQQMPHFQGITKEDLEKEISYVDTLAAHVNKYSKGMVSGGMAKGAATELLRHFQATHAQLEPLTNIVASYLVGSKKGTATSADATDAGARLGEALKSGRFMGIADMVGSFSRAQMKIIKEMSYAQRIDFVKAHALYGTQTIAEISKTGPGQLAILRNQVAKDGIKAGEQWKEVQLKGELISLKFTGMFNAVFYRLGDLFNKTFGGVLDWIDQNQDKLKGVIDSIFDPKPGQDIFAKLGGMWNEFFIKFKTDNPTFAAGLDYAWARFQDIQTAVAGIGDAWNAFTTGFSKGFAGAEQLDTKGIGVLVDEAKTGFFAILGDQMRGVTEAFKAFGEFLSKPETLKAFEQLGSLFGSLAKFEWNSVIGSINTLSKAVQSLADTLGNLIAKADSVKTLATPSLNVLGRILGLPDFTLGTAIIKSWTQPAVPGPSSPPKPGIATPSPLPGIGGGEAGGMGAAALGVPIPVTVTHYAYAGDSTPDRFSAAGIGNRGNRLTPLTSFAVTDSVAKELGLSLGQPMQASFDGQSLVGYYDDTAPQSDARVDIYDPAGAFGSGAAGNSWSTQGRVAAMAGGGIVNSRLLSWIGESGPEAVIPMRRNDPRALGLMSQAADATGYGGMGGITIHLNISGGGNAHEIAHHLDNYMRREFPRHLNDAFMEHKRRNFN